MIEPVKHISNLDIYRTLESQKLSNKQKVEFLKQNNIAIKDIMKSEISKAELKEIMSHRPLIRFRPLKNSFTKQGDDLILAQALGIAKKDIKQFINSTIDTNFENQHPDNIEKIKTYVYRHGTKDQVASFLQYELSDVKTTLTKLYKTLELNSGGLADYFSRPIHRMDNRTLAKLYKTIDTSLRNSAKAGYITDDELNSTAEWALVKIYQIQNNSKLIRAYNAYKDLT
ncbi:hypothetical protein J6E39_04805 [bacterium]|nr:hypothetical protein [bacterium]